jgi:hypothetical protein
MKLLLLLCLLCLPQEIASTATDTIAVKEGAPLMDPHCPPIQDYTAIYHTETACNQREQNRFMDHVRNGQHEAIQASGIYHVPDRRTVYCPLAPQLDDLFQHFTTTDPTYQYGYSTMWIVHNNASTPVVLGWVERRGQHPNNYQYREVSAIDGTTSPPHRDKNAILQPNEWKVINTQDGHVFFVRRLEKNGNLGPVLMQHRVGLIPIQNVFGHQLENFCDPNDQDVEPVVVVGDHVERAPEFKRTLRPPLRPCNIQDIGFRNLVGCPLNVYYSGRHNMTGIPRKDGEECSFTPKSCHEQFKFHLGKNPYSTDFHWAWDSRLSASGKR